jgi:hypothetical protein
MKSSQNNPSGNFSFHNAQQPASKPNAPHLPATKMIVVAIIVHNWGTIPTIVPALGSRIKGKVRSLEIRTGSKMFR